MKRNFFKDNRGIIAIEMLISFVGFMIFTLIIITFINVASIQLRFHHALTQTAHEVALYSHVLEMFGVVDGMRNIHTLGESTRTQLNDGIDTVFGVMDDIGSMYTSVTNWDSSGARGAFESATSGVQGGWDILSDWANNPFDFIRGLIWVVSEQSISIGTSLFMGNIVAPSFFMRYLNFQNGMNGLEYVASIPIREDSLDFVWWDQDWFSAEHLRINGTNFFAPNNTEFLSGENADTIAIHIRYYLNLGQFFLLPDNLRWESEVRQEVKVRGWVGDGRKFDTNLMR